MRRRLRWVGKIVTTVGLGATLGFLVPTAAAEYGIGQPQQTQQSSAALATSVIRRFLVAYLTSDQQTLQELQAEPATLLSSAQLEHSADIQVVSLTELGTSVYSSGALYTYAAEVVAAGQGQGLIGIRVRVEPTGIAVVPPPTATQ